MQLRGCGTALVTPFHQDGSIDDLPCAIWSRGKSSPALIFSYPAAPPAKLPPSPTTNGCTSSTQRLRSQPDASPSSVAQLPTPPTTPSRRPKNSPPARSQLHPHCQSLLQQATQEGSIAISRRSPKPSATSPSFSTMSPDAPPRTSSLQPWRASPRFPTSWASKKPAAI